MHGDAPLGAHWEIYHNEPRSTEDPAAWRTEVVIPYRVG
jgi:hypothetical protein